MGLPERVYVLVEDFPEDSLNHLGIGLVRYYHPSSQDFLTRDKQNGYNNPNN